ncbi:MAG: hypothetical protein V3U53_03530 [bacterium]
MRCWNKIGKWAAILSLAVFTWGCATSLVLRKVSLFYEGPKPAEVIDASAQAPSEILVAPFVDLRKNKKSFGTYIWGHLSVDYTSSPGTVAEAVTHLMNGFLQQAGLKTISGQWDGELSSLSDIPTENAIYGEIERLDFSGRGRFYRADKRGIVRLIIKWGNRNTRKVVTRTVEVTPDRQDYHLLDTRYDHVSQMEGVIRKAINRAVREAMSKLFKTPESSRL